jgi:hypothetical protein
VSRLSGPGADHLVEAGAGDVLVLAGELGGDLVDRSAPRLTPREVAEHAVDDREPRAVERRRVGRVAVEREVVVERVQRDVGVRELRGQDREGFLEVLARVEDLVHGGVDLRLCGVGDVHAAEVVADHRDRHEAGLRDERDRVEDVVLGIVDQEVVGVLAGDAFLVERHGGAAHAGEARLDLLRVPERRGAAEVEVGGDRVAHRRCSGSRRP